MATTFYHNGNYFEIIEGTEEVILRRSGEKSGDVILPKYAMYHDKRYTVTKIIPQKVKFMKNRNAADRRKKADWYEESYPQYASLFCRENYFYDGETSYLILSPKLDITSILIPSTVTEIGISAFKNCCSLKSLTIPDSVTKIGYEAFRGCTSLKSLTIPDSVTEIGNAAFCGCTSLKSLIIPDSVTKIGSTAFAFACGLESLRLSSNVKRLSGSLFGWGGFSRDFRPEMGADQRNPNSIRIEIPSIVEEIGSNAFDVFQNAEITIYNEPGEVMVAPNAFTPTTSVKYVGKKAKAVAKPKPEPKPEPKPIPKAKPKPEPKVVTPATNGNGLVLQRGTVVADLKAAFNARFGAKLRVYSGRSQAEESATLGELGLTNEGDFVCRASLTVGSFIERMQSEFGLKVKVYTCDEWVAVLDGLTLKSAGKVKKKATKADMESMIL